ATVKVLPEYSEFVLSTDINKSVFTCEIFFENTIPYNNSGKGNRLYYNWFRNGVPIHVHNYSLHLSSYPDPVNNNQYLPAFRQGSYSCKVLLDGYKYQFQSPELDYFYPDIATYIINVYNISWLRQYSDFSKIDFSRGRSQWNKIMATLMEAVPPAVGKAEWDDLYISQRSPVSHSKPYFSDVCFEKIVPSSETSYNGTLIWFETKHTKSAISEPMCLNDWRLITGQCKPSAIIGAQWQPFDYSNCTKYQLAIKDKETKCPNGFKLLDNNLCYAIYQDEKTFDEAE
ncbi:unnamed protein product, partial [Larinioides sclopetarius]